MTSWNKFLAPRWNHSFPGCLVSKLKFGYLLCFCKGSPSNAVYPISQSPDARPLQAVYLIPLPSHPKQGWLCGPGPSDIFCFLLSYPLFFILYKFPALHPFLQISEWRQSTSWNINFCLSSPKSRGSQSWLYMQTTQEILGIPVAESPGILFLFVPGAVAGISRSLQMILVYRHSWESPV